MKKLGKMAAAAITVALLVLACRDVHAQGTDSQWKTGAALQQALATTIDVVDWPQGSRLRERLRWLAQWQKVAIFLDRRIDPDRAIALSEHDVSFAALLDLIAAQVDATAVYLGDVVYIGPRDEVADLPRVAQQLRRQARKLPAPLARKFLVARSWRWDMLSEPRSLLSELCAQADVQLEGADQIPHDLWPETDLPALSWIDRMTLVLAGFDLTCEFTSQRSTLRLVPLPPPRMESHAYSTTLSQPSLARILQRFPATHIRQTAEGVTLEGSAAEHARLQELLGRTTGATHTGRTQPGRTVHSLRVQKQPVGAILKTLQQQLHLRLQVAPDVQQQLQTRISFDLREVPLDALLEATLAPASLSFRREGEVIRIQRKQ